MIRFIVLAGVLTVQAVATQSFSFSYGGRTYTITTTGVQHVFSWDNSHWTYEPSVVLPSPQTNYQYVLIFSSGTTYLEEAIYATTSSSPLSFPSPPALILNIMDTSNLCDMIDARPLWDGSLWHVYVQAIETCPGNDDAGIYEATGPNLWSLSWVYDYGNHARRIIGPYDRSGQVGIGEVIQWFNSLPYRGRSSMPFVTTFNDWTYAGQDCQPFNPNGSYNCYEYCPRCSFNGTDVFTYAGANGTSPMYFWYYSPAATGYFHGHRVILHDILGCRSESGKIKGEDRGALQRGTLTVAWPDVILGGSLDSPTAGNPGVGFQNNSAGCSYGVGFFPDPVPFDNPNFLAYDGGFYFPGYLEATTGAGGAMGSPRVARNPYGYLDPVPGSSPLTWLTYIYYTDSSKGAALLDFPISWE
jgi:hypothetical protein